jgi:hypothetical protein
MMHPDLYEFAVPLFGKKSEIVSPYWNGNGIPYTLISVKDKNQVCRN